MDYIYPGESPISIRVGDWFRILRRGESGKKFESSWIVADILDEQRISEAGIIVQKVIVAKLNDGRYVDEWKRLRDMSGRVLKFDDYVVAHRLKARNWRSA